MAGKTGKAAGSAAGKTLGSKTASTAARRAAASDLAQVGNNKATSARAASSAGKTLGSKTASKAAKRAAASDLAQRANEAVREMTQQIRRRLPHGRSSEWGVAATCTSGSFSFGYGNLASGAGGSPASFSPCVQRMIASYPNPQAGLGAALEHAER